MKRLAEEFGPDWAMQHIVPQVVWILCCNDLVFNSGSSSLEKEIIKLVFDMNKVTRKGKFKSKCS